MNEIQLSSDLNVITAEINSYKQIAGQSVFEIGKRLKFVKENDLAHGQFGEWLKKIDFNHSTANKMMKAYDEFANSESTPNLGTAKIFELLSMPESIERSEFLMQEHIIPSTGESKTVEEMTLRELREVKKELKETQKRASDIEKNLKDTINQRNHFESLWKQANNKPPRVETRVVEVVPHGVKKQLEEDKFKIDNLRIGLQQAQEELEHLKVKSQIDDFDDVEAERQKKRLQFEADKTVLEYCAKLNRLSEPLAITSYMVGAFGFANEGEKKRVRDTVEQMELIISNIKAALNGRKVGEAI